MIETITIVILIVLIILTLATLVLTLKTRSAIKENKTESLTNAVAEGFDRNEKILKDELSRSREEFSNSFKSQREELQNSFKIFSDMLINGLKETSETQAKELKTFSEQINVLTSKNEEKFEQLKEKVEAQLKEMHEKNEKKLEEMRLTVDEKLHDTLEKRLSESFKQVSERLEQVYKGLGDMQELARGVGDLKNVLTNVKTRGTWGEVQLESIIEQILTTDQYEKNVSTKKGSSDRVEIAIKLPGKDNPDEKVYLPIDAKFPIEDYQRLQDAQEKGDLESISIYNKSIETTIKKEAKKISEKYIDPPNTTDFAILFVPIEGLYAEILRTAGLAEFLQREYRVTIAGPTTLAALLNSLQMGFRTLAIQKRSSEVWKVLGAVKTEFKKFGDVLANTKKKLDSARNTLDQAETRTRQITRKLKDVEELPAAESAKLLPGDDEFEME